MEGLSAGEANRRRRAEIIRPMAAPVLSGILIADEVITLLLPVRFVWVRRPRQGFTHSPVFLAGVR